MNLVSDADKTSYNGVVADRLTGFFNGETTQLFVFGYEGTVVVLGFPELHYDVVSFLLGWMPAGGWVISLLRQLVAAFVKQPGTFFEVLIASLDSCVGIGGFSGALGLAVSQKSRLKLMVL